MSDPGEPTAPVDPVPVDPVPAPTDGAPTTGHAWRMRLRWGGATDTGMVRSNNQDSLHVGPRICIVADGMGGHAGGEVASALAIETVRASLEPDGADPAPPRVTDLITAIQSANEAVWDRSGAEPSLAGMGTTIVAAARVLEDGEERLAILNVGDSRAYRLSQGYFDQVSEDHSLVGDLVREGRITAAEARAHPRKNIVTRAIGIEDHVRVDEFQLLPRTGDRYLLCSDGLTDEVTDDDIAETLRTVPDPGDAASTLVAQANRGGGRDNITVIVVDVVDDGLDEAARAALPDHDAFSSHPDADTANVDPVTGAVLRHDPDEDDRAGTGLLADLPAADVTGDDGTAPTKQPRVVTLRSLAYVGAVLAVVAAGAWLAWSAARNTYTVALDGDLVVIQRGSPDGFLWFDPTFEEGTELTRSELPADAVAALEDGVSQSTLTAARGYVENLAERAASFTPSLEPGTSAPNSDVPDDPFGGALDPRFEDLSGTPLVISTTTTTPPGDPGPDGTTTTTSPDPAAGP